MNRLIFMSDTKKDTSETEKALYVYSRALATGDFETMARIHQQAETDPALERALDELLDADAAEAGIPEPTPQEVLETVAVCRGATRKGPARN